MLTIIDDMWFTIFRMKRISFLTLNVKSVGTEHDLRHSPDLSIEQTPFRSRCLHCICPHVDNGLRTLSEATANLPSHPISRRQSVFFRFNHDWLHAGKVFLYVGVKSSLSRETSPLPQSLSIISRGLAIIMSFRFSFCWCHSCHEDWISFNSLPSGLNGYRSDMFHWIDRRTLIPAIEHSQTSWKSPGSNVIKFTAMAFERQSPLRQHPDREDKSSISKDNVSKVTLRWTSPPNARCSVPFNLNLRLPVRCQGLFLRTIVWTPPVRITNARTNGLIW